MKMVSAFSVLGAAAAIRLALASPNSSPRVISNSNLEFLNAEGFSCPDNVDNTCTTKQETPWDWRDLAVGSVSTYAGFKFKGWTCENHTDIHNPGTSHTSGTGKVISGTCSENDDDGLSIGVGADAVVDRFSIDSFHMSSEFDTRLEFYYDMPDGSVCRQSGDCKRNGSTIANEQCGGAKRVRIIYPSQVAEQPLRLKPECKIFCHRIQWNCNTESSASTSRLVVPGSDSTVMQTSDRHDQGPNATSVVVIPSSFLNTYDPGSIIPEAYNKPSSSCTSTQTECTGMKNNHSLLSITPLAAATVLTAPDICKQPEGPSPVVCLHGEATGSFGTLTIETPTFSWLPLSPFIVARCLNTFLSLRTKCKNNQDIDCYCPNKEFVHTILECIYAHGYKDNLIFEALGFFQDMCGSYISANPHITEVAQSISRIIATSTAIFPILPSIAPMRTMHTNDTSRYHASLNSNYIITPLTASRPSISASFVIPIAPTSVRPLTAGSARLNIRQSIVLAAAGLVISTFD